MVEFTAMEQNKEKRMKTNEDSLRELWGNIKCNNIRIIGVPEGEEREKGPEKIFEEIIVKNFPKTWARKYSITSRKCRESHTGKIQRETRQDILIKLSKTKYKEKILRAAREKQHTREST